MVLRADPQFQALLDQSAKQDAELAGLTATRGEANPHLVDLQAEKGATIAKLAARGMELSGLKRAEVLKLRDLSVHDERAHLFERLVSSAADADALSGMQTELERQIDGEKARIVTLAPDISRLDNAKHDVQVAEAVFSSALARLDTNKADFFVSYPLAQILEWPTLPHHASRMTMAMALGGAMLGTLFLLMATALARLRVGLLRKVLKTEPPRTWQAPAYDIASMHFA
jgi:uncharacterized protein involved in exopolysaccharide biosynthesis